MTKQRRTEMEEQGAKRKKTDCDRKTKQRQTVTEEQGAKSKKTKQDCMRKKREEMRLQSQNDRRDCNGEDMTNVIDRAKKEAKQFLHRTQDPANPPKHRATVCIICNCFIIGTGRHWCTQWKTWHQKLRRVLPNHTKSRGEETIPSPRSTRYVALTLIEEIS